MAAMKKGADALKSIHQTLYVFVCWFNGVGKAYLSRLSPPPIPHPMSSAFLCEPQLTHLNSQVDKVDATMDSIREQMDITNDISEAISNPVGMGVMLDEDDLAAELEALEQEELDDRLKGADHVPLHTPASPTRVSAPAHAEEDDEEAQLRQLQAELAM